MQFQKLFDSMPLQCPHCGFDYLHQKAIEYFSRKEDAEKGLHVSVTSLDTVIIDDRLVGNPSSRRDGIKISFTCEGCSAPCSLAIVQHKGQTFLGWV